MVGSEVAMGSNVVSYFYFYYYVGVILSYFNDWYTKVRNIMEGEL